MRTHRLLPFLLALPILVVAETSCESGARDYNSSGGGGTGGEGGAGGAGGSGGTGGTGGTGGAGSCADAPFAAPVLAPVFNTHVVAGASLKYDYGPLSMNPEETLAVVDYCESGMFNGACFPLFYQRATVDEAFQEWTPPGLEDMVGTGSSSLVQGGLLFFYRYSPTPSSMRYLHMTPSVTPSAPTTGVDFTKYSNVQSYFLYNGKAVYFSGLAAGDTARHIHRADVSDADITNDMTISVGMDDLDNNVPVVSEDEETMYLRVGTPGESAGRIHVARKSNGIWGQAEPIPELDAPPEYNDAPAWISADGCVLYFLSDRENPIGDRRIWMATRKTL